MIKRDKVVLFGAGATGRGHVGLLAWQAGCELVLVDRNTALVSLLAQAGSYTARLYGPSGVQEVAVTGYRAYDAADRDAVAAEVATADLVLTAVFDQNLSDVAVTLARAVTLCRAAGRTDALNCVACENMMDSSSTLGRHVAALLSGEDRRCCEQVFAFPDSMISRVVPRPEPDPLVIVTEDYNEWTVRAEAFRGRRPRGLEAMELVDNQTARLERKLFIHNGGHAVCGFFGFHRGHRYIHEAVADPVVAEHVLGALDELGEVVMRRHGFSAESIDRYKQDLAERGSIAEMRDEVLRVVRDPIRKLSPRERLVAPALMAAGYGMEPVWLERAIAAALRYGHPADEQSLLLSERLAAQGLQAVLTEVCGIPADSPLRAGIEREWSGWRPLREERT